MTDNNECIECNYWDDKSHCCTMSPIDKAYICPLQLQDNKHIPNVY